MKKSVIVLNVIVALLFSCQQNDKPVVDKNEPSIPKRREPKKLGYEIQNAKQWLDSNSNESSQQAIVFAVNRTDRANFAKMDSVLIPVDLTGDIVYYLPFPLAVQSLSEVDKIIFFSYATQTFGAYEKGVLVRTGQTNMGRENDKTPTGLFFTNWKAKKTTSTFNDEWELRWNFNIANKAGVGWHQYSLPGYPASHSCLRLSEEDAKYLFNWADKWILADKSTILVKGTPVIVFGSYDFNSPKPWLQLLQNPHALDISENEIEKIAAPYLNEIIIEQKKQSEHIANTE